MKKVCVTGGASFIGSHLCERLKKEGCEVTVIDDLSSGKRENLEGVDVKLIVSDVRNIENTAKAFKGCDTVFHLAAQHGGRGYIDTHPVFCSQNMAIDADVYKVAAQQKVKQVVFASSACVYPKDLQGYNSDGYLLKEEDANFKERGKAFPDGEYGWAKLMGELQLLAYVKEGHFKGVSCRLFTAYGPRENETHAIIALILKTFLKLDPFPLWGTGKETRNFTYVLDTVEGMVRAAKTITDGSAVNVGTPIHHYLTDAAREIFNIVGWKPKEIKFESDKPVGVARRAASTDKLKSLVGWEPSISLKDGLKKTIKWYKEDRFSKINKKDLNRLLTER